MGHLVVAPDKFRGTATATAVAQAVADRARGCGWTVDSVPMADGGEGLMEVLGGTPVAATVTGPTGAPVAASWSWLGGTAGVAVIEAAAAAGLELAGGPERNHPIGSTTRGVGELVLRAVDAGARQVIVGCGGSATTDGGLGALTAIGGAERLRGVDLVAAYDVTTRFLDAARVFGPQKGASPEAVAALSTRLDALARRYRADFGVDVTTAPGGGAAGGLAGGLHALGARLTAGAGLVADLVDLRARLETADLVVTGEGHLDATSLAGKVVHEVIARTPPSTPVLCVVGDADVEILRPDGRTLRPDGDSTAVGPGGAVPPPRAVPVHVVRLAVELGDAEARRDTPERVADVVQRVLQAPAGSGGRLAGTGRRRAS